MYTEEQVRKATLDYFQGDELATNVFMTKYCLKDREGNFQELTPQDMHKRYPFGGSTFFCQGILRKA